MPQCDAVMAFHSVLPNPKCSHLKKGAFFLMRSWRLFPTGKTNAEQVPAKQLWLKPCLDPDGPADDELQGVSVTPLPCPPGFLCCQLGQGEAGLEHTFSWCLLWDQPPLRTSLIQKVVSQLEITLAGCALMHMVFIHTFPPPFLTLAFAGVALQHVRGNIAGKT